MGLFLNFVQTEGKRALNERTFIEISYIDRFPPPGPKIFYITFFEPDLKENAIRGRLWANNNGTINLSDETTTFNANVTPIRYVHIDTRELRYFRLVLDSVRCSIIFTFCRLFVYSEQLQFVFGRGWIHHCL